MWSRSCYGPSTPQAGGKVAAMESASNKVVCPECGRVRLETPPGTTALPTIGMARKRSGAAGSCDCGRAHGEHPDDDRPRED